MFYHKQRRVLFCLKEKGVTQSILVQDIIHTNNIKVEKSSEPAGTSQIWFYFISLNMNSFFLKIFKLNQMEVALKMKIFLHVPSLKNMTLIFKRQQHINTHSSNKHSRCTHDIYCSLLKAEQNVLF